MRVQDQTPATQLKHPFQVGLTLLGAGTLRIPRTWTEPVVGVWWHCTIIKLNRTSMDVQDQHGNVTRYFIVGPRHISPGGIIGWAGITHRNFVRLHTPDLLERVEKVARKATASDLKELAARALRHRALDEKAARDERKEIAQRQEERERMG